MDTNKHTFLSLPIWYMTLTLSDPSFRRGGRVMITFTYIDNKILQQDHCLKYNVTYIIYGLKASNSMCIQTHFSGNPHHVKTITSSALALTFVLKTPYIIFNIFKNQKDICVHEIYRFSYLKLIWCKQHSIQTNTHSCYSNLMRNK